MTEYHFESHAPVDVYVENGKGAVEIHAIETTESRVELTGADAEHTRVDFDDGRLRVIAPQQRGGLFSGNQRLDMRITVPSGSDLSAKLGSADLVTHGSLGRAELRTGSGDLALEHLSGEVSVETGSGDVVVQHVEQRMRVKSGSGDVQVDHAGADLSVSTGSGDLRVGHADGEVSAKTGSGDLRLGEARGDVAFTTGSGYVSADSLHRGRFTSRTASGDVRVGVPAGTPVWTDLLTVSGRIRSTLAGAGQPEPGEDHLELRIKTASGDIDLNRI